VRWEGEREREIGLLEGASLGRGEKKRRGEEALSLLSHSHLCALFVWCGRSWVLLLEKEKIGGPFWDWFGRFGDVQY
jgi:hypothetical protein